MKKNCSFLLISLAFLLGSCSKSDNGNCTFKDLNIVATASEISSLQNYITSNSITASQHSSGIFYTIENGGTGINPTVCSNVTVTYTGSLLSNGYVFDSNTSATGTSFILGALIQGWQKGLPLIKSGGRITLYIPPSLGYGSVDKYDNNGNVAIPAYSYLKFTINLMDVQ